MFHVTCLNSSTRDKEPLVNTAINWRWWVVGGLWNLGKDVVTNTVWGALVGDVGPERRYVSHCAWQEGWGKARTN